MVRPEWMKEAPQPISSVLIANRGEIACRIIRACQEMEIEAIAIQSSSDEGALHTEMADKVISLSGESLADTYLNGDAIIDAANKPALTAPVFPIATVPTGIPFGICTIDNKLSRPFKLLL